MIEKVNPAHPDKLADRIAGAIVDMAYSYERDPKIAVEALVGHGKCHIIVETDEARKMEKEEIRRIAERIAGNVRVVVDIYPQDEKLAQNQEKEIRCGDNGIFRGVPLTEEQKELSKIAREIYQFYPSDGKYIMDGKKLFICQSGGGTEWLRTMFPNALVNPLGPWTGGPGVDCGAVNRKIGSDMADSATGGGLHGKDLSKADVSVNIYAFMKAQETGEIVQLSCAIGDTVVDGRPYEEIVEIAREYVRRAGGFEKLAEWGLF